jgi:hypothetical protein
MDDSLNTTPPFPLSAAQDYLITNKNNNAVKTNTEQWL